MSITNIHLDAVGGIAGDMFVAALLDLRPDIIEKCEAAVATLGFPDRIDLKLKTHNDSIFQGKRFSVDFINGNSANSYINHVHWSEIRERLQTSELTEEIRDTALEIFTLLAEAEAFVHGIEIDKVTFHEVGAVDSIIDIVSSSAIITSFAPCEWSIGLIPKGSGLVQSQHGLLPVPAPATTSLLKGFLLIDDGEIGERITPTGAAILQYLKPTQGSNSMPLKLLGTGIGFGTRKLKSRSNILRVTAYKKIEQSLQGDEIEVLRCEIDDQTTEDLAVALDNLRQTKGVIDVCQWPVIGKKGRMAIALQIIAKVSEAEDISDKLFDETTTIGVRRCRQYRKLVSREFIDVDGIQVKLADRPSGLTAKAEMDHFVGTKGQLERSRRRNQAELKAIKKRK